MQKNAANADMLIKRNYCSDFMLFEFAILRDFVGLH